VPQETDFERYYPDQDTLAAVQGRADDAGCFECMVVRQIEDNAPPAHLVCEDDATLAFLDPYPRRYGYCLVIPRDHRVLVTGDFSLQEYLAQQWVVYAVSEAVRQEVGVERMYILSLGSNQGNAHAHWHVVPLPPGIPFEQQQTVGWHLGVLRIPDEEMVSLASGPGWVICCSPAARLCSKARSNAPARLNRGRRSDNVRLWTPRTKATTCTRV